MERLRAVITGVGAYYPDYVLTNEELSRMVDTTDEWIMKNIGMDRDEVLRLKQISGLAALFADKDFSIPGKIETEEQASMADYNFSED